MSGDSRVINEGTVVGIAPITAESRAWWDEHVAPAEAWPNSGDFTWCDHRSARDIVAGFQADGLTVRLV